MDENTLSELQPYDDQEVDDLLGKAINDTDYPLDKEYYATEVELDEDEESESVQTASEDGNCLGYISEPGGKGDKERGQIKGRCH